MCECSSANCMCPVPLVGWLDRRWISHLLPWDVLAVTMLVGHWTGSGGAGTKYEVELPLSGHHCPIMGRV